MDLRELAHRSMISQNDKIGISLLLPVPRRTRAVSSAAPVPNQRQEWKDEDRSWEWMHHRIVQAIPGSRVKLQDVGRPDVYKCDNLPLSPPPPFNVPIELMKSLLKIRLPF